MFVLAAALLLAAAAYAGNGGFAPETPHSPNAGRINDSYKWIALFAALIFVVVEGALLWFVVRYRRRGRPRSAEGPQIHGATRLELIWTAVPVLILAAVAGFLFYELPGIKNVPEAKAEGGPLVIKVDAHQFYWQFTYPGGAVSIDELRAPVNRTVRVEIASHDVAHSWWIPELGGKFDAIPGQQTHTWFKADQVGTYVGKCGEFCGVFHAEMEANVKVTPQAEYQTWVDQGAAAALGRSEWEGVCAKCHGLAGQGDVGPQITGNAVIASRDSLIDLLRNGREPTRTVNGMPAVGKTWSNDELAAAVAAIQKRYGTGGASGG
jgi:cytochrome c oxidase subunit 2